MYPQNSAIFGAILSELRFIATEYGFDIQSSHL